MPTVSAPSLAGDLRDDRGCARARAAALTGGDEHHVGAAEGGADVVVGLLGGRAADSGSAPEPRPWVSSSPMWIFAGASESCELLHVGVDGDEVDLGDTGVDHPVDGVEPAAADADDLMTARYEPRSPVWRC